MAQTLRRIVGSQLFDTHRRDSGLLQGEELPEDWGTIGAAMLTLFVMLTLENFPAYMDAGMSVHPVGRGSTSSHSC
jgi:hypothetical protein